MCSVRCLEASPCKDGQTLTKKQWICGPGDVRAYDGARFCILRQQGAKGTSEEAADHQKLVLGVSVGTTLAMGVCIILWLVRRHPAKAKKSALRVNYLDPQFDFIVIFSHAGSFSPSCV